MEVRIRDIVSAAIGACALFTILWLGLVFTA